MKRRNFLKTLGISALAVPVAIEAVKGIEVPKTVAPEDEMLLKSLHHNEYVQHFNECKEHIEEGFDWRTINLIAPVKPSKAGEAIYIYADEDKLRIHNVIHIPAKYFDWYEITLAYLVVEKNTLKISDSYIVCEYKCFPFCKDLALTKEIPITQQLIIGANVFNPGMGEPI
jgi:hypothetical protein